VLSKTDLLPHLTSDLPACLEFIRGVNAGIPVFPLSAVTGEGMGKWLDWLLKG
jgi:hydrogenase nickel incorporation protein HypB